MKCVKKTKIIKIWEPELSATEMTPRHVDLKSNLPHILRCAEKNEVQRLLKQNKIDYSNL